MHYPDGKHDAVERKDDQAIEQRKAIEDEIRRYLGKAIRAFDFNSPLGNTFPGMTGVEGDALYNKETGYGWVTPVVTFDATWEGLDLDALNTDFAMGMGTKTETAVKKRIEEGTEFTEKGIDLFIMEFNKLTKPHDYRHGEAIFRADVPNGAYEVITFSGGSNHGPHYYGYRINGKEVLSLTKLPVGGKVNVHKFYVMIDNGQLELELFTLENSEWILGGLIVMPLDN